MELQVVFESEPYIQLEEAEHSLHRLKIKRDELLESGFVSQQIEAAYGSTIEALENKLSNAASEPELQSLVAQLGIEGIKGVEQVEPLETVLEPSEYMDLRGAFYTRIFRAAAFFEKYGPVGSDAEKFLRKVAAGGYPVGQVAIETVQNPEEPTREVSPVVTQPKREIDVKIGVTFIKIGGQMITFDNRRGRDDQTDYSQPRRDALLYMLTQPEDAQISARELKVASFGEVVDTNTFAQVRSWLFGLTHNRTPLFVSNGKNNQAIRYMVNPRFKVDPIISERSKDLSTPESASPGKVTPTAEALEIQGLKPGDIFITAYKLKLFDFMFEEVALPPIPAEIVDDLRNSAPDLSEFRGQDEVLDKIREEAFDRVIDFLDSPGLFDFIDSIDKNPENQPADYKFIECFLTTLDDDQMKLVKKLLTARILPNPVSGRGHVIAAPTKIVQAKDGTSLYPLPEINSQGYIVWGVDGIQLKVRDSDPETTESPQTEAEVTGQLEDGDTVSLHDPEGEIESSEDEVQAGPAADIESTQKTKAEIIFETAQLNVSLFIDALVAQNMSATETYDISQVRNFVPQNARSQWTATKLRGMMFNGSKSQKGIPKRVDMEKLVTLFIEKGRGMSTLSKQAKKELISEALARVRSIQQK